MSAMVRQHGLLRQLAQLRRLRQPQWTRRRRVWCCVGHRRGLQQRQEASAAARRPEAVQGVIQAGLEKADALSALILPAAIVISVPCPVG